MKRLSSLVALSVLLAGCQTTRVETRTVTKYLTVPDQLLICKPIDVVDVNTVETEADYNRLFVVPLYGKYEECYKSMEKIKEWNSKHGNGE